MNTPNQHPVEPIQAQDSTHGDSDVAQNETQPSTRIVTEPQSPPANTENEKPTRRLRKIANLRKAGIFWMEIGTFVALIAYATITKNQWQESIKATSAATTAADAALSAADTANKTLQFTTDASHLDQRPWVYASRFILSGEPEDDGKGSTIDVKVVNAGKTPALNVETMSQVIVWQGEPPFSTDFHKIELGKVVSRGIVFPNNSSDTTYEFATDPFPFGGKNLIAYNSKVWFIYVRIKIKYMDVFGDSHWTTACTYHRHGSPLGDFGYCKRGNEIGDEKKQTHY